MEKNIKKILFVLVVVIFISGNFCYADNKLNSYDYIQLEMNNKINFNIIKEDDHNVEEFVVSSYIMPITYNGSQYLNNFSTNFDNYNFEEDSNGQIVAKFFYNQSTLQTSNSIKNKFLLESVKFEPEINKKQKYPITDLKDEYEKYLEFGELIDVNDNIKSQASKLAYGHDDTFIIASKIAKWIREDINYDLSTLVKNPNQKSTEVFESKSGVCKEISNLYVSMMRSLGIPARIVTGYSYTENQEIIDLTGSKWGGHAWTEVLIGDKWVPFDLTYNQYGYVDASHIIIDKSFYVRNNNIYIKSYGHGYKFDGLAKVDNSFNVIRKENLNNQSNNFEISLSGPNELGIGSYGYIKVNVENIKNKYSILFLKLSQIREVEILGLKQQMIILKPRENKEIIFRYRIIDDLDPDYKYTFPFKVYNDFVNKDFDVKVRSDYISIEKTKLPENNQNLTSSLSNNDLSFNCNYILDYPYNMILCSVKNPNNYEINNVNICIKSNKSNCNKIDLRLNEEKSFSFDTKNFDEEIIYDYEDKRGSLDLHLEKPSLIYDYNVTDNYLIINYSVKNFGRNLEVNIYKNETLFIGFEKEYSKLKVPLEYGKNNIAIKLELKNNIYDSQSFEFYVEKPVFNPIKIFFEDLWNMIKSVFSFLN